MQTAHGPAASLAGHSGEPGLPGNQKVWAQTAVSIEGLALIIGRTFISYFISIISLPAISSSKGHCKKINKYHDTLNLSFKTLTYFLLLHFLSPHHISLVLYKCFDLFSSFSIFFSLMRTFQK